MTEPSARMSTAQVLGLFAEELDARAIDDATVSELVLIAGKWLIDNEGLVVTP